MTVASPVLDLPVRRALDFTQVDGIFGPAAKTAAGQFRRDGGLAVDGVCRAATPAALGGDGAQSPTLTQGSHGSVVEGTCSPICAAFPARKPGSPAPACQLGT
jgi:hypothetical protein